MTELVPSRRTLEEVPMRAVAFLRGLGTCIAARALMSQAGYTEADHAEGWSLVHAASGFEPGRKDPIRLDIKVRDAIAELDAWDEPHFRRIGAAAYRYFPEQAAFLFQGLTPAQGGGAVISVATLLGRIDMLEKGRSDATREADQACAALLAKRGYPSTERARLIEVIKIAQSAPAVPPPSTDEDAAQEQALLRLYAWFNDWSETARAVIKRRDHLIRLGLAQRRSRTGASEQDDMAGDSTEESKTPV